MSGASIPAPSSRSRRSWRWLTVAVLVVAAMVGALLPGLRGTQALAMEGADLAEVPSTTPSSLGDLDLSTLQYGDPTEGVDLVQPPEADASGSTSLGYELPVPPGRAGVAPDLALGYEAGDANGWVGVGWDLSVGAITVETTFGAPRYLTALESETYAIDGDRLFPNAIRSTLAARTGPVKADFVRSVETEHEQIVRHGSSPSTYCWQVRDRSGNERWYGGEPDAAGACVRRADAVLTAPATGVTGGGDGDYFWGLAYTNDISGNTVRYTYDKQTGVAIGQRDQGDAFGVSLYLKSITYTGFRNPKTAPDQPAYRVDFLRDAQVPGSPLRLDVTVDASTGQPVVTRDLLRRVEVHTLTAAGAPAALVKAWNLRYTTGPYDKSLLAGVAQVGADGKEFASHSFSWYDDVRKKNADGSLTYDGFGPTEQWGATASDKANIAATSALGASFRGGADGGAYIGFNPLIPSKLGSFGGSFNIAGGQSREVSTLVDLDGDGLPDKVWVDGSGVVHYRPNLHRPGAVKTGNSWFGTAQTVTGIDSLGASRDLRVDVHFEAYPVVAIQVGGGFGFSWGDRYFADANGDGRVDFIKPGQSGDQTVFYNVLNAQGVPTFVDSTLATGLEVPLDAFSSTLATTLPADVATLLTSNSPRIDTVRRWVAPFTGRVLVSGEVALTSGAEYRGDGARVSIEHRAKAVWDRTLTKAAPSADPGKLAIAEVTAGEAVYFRLDVVDNAADDEVSWAPEVRYVDAADKEREWVADAQGRSQSSYAADDDFTLFGRNGARTSVPNTGTADTTVQLTVTVDPTVELTDDLRITAKRGRTGRPASEDATFGPTTVPQRTTDAVTATFDVPIRPETDSVGPDGKAGTQDDVHEQDWVAVDVLSDSPVDPTQYSVSAALTDPAAAPAPLSGTELESLDEADVELPDSIPVVPGVRVFGRSSSTTAYSPVRATADGTATLEVAFANPQVTNDIRSDVVLTVKAADEDDNVGVVARQTFTVAQAPLLGLSGTGKVSFTAVKDTDYWLEANVLDPVVAAAVGPTITSKTTIGGAEQKDVAQANWPDVDGVFPSGNRGWGLAGYNADAPGASPTTPIVASHFDLTQKPGGGTYTKDTPVPDASSVPSVTQVRGGQQQTVPTALPYIPWGPADSDVADRWRSGGKDTLYGTGTTMQSDRLGADIPLAGAPAAGRTAPAMVSSDSDFNFMVGLVASFTAGAGGGKDVTAFDDYNGDGLPDVRSGSSVEFTGPRGAKAATVADIGKDDFGTALGLGGGLSGTAIAVGSSKGASKAKPTSKKTSRGMNVGAGFSISAEWDNPLDEGSAIPDDKAGSEKRDILNAALGALPGSTPPMPNSGRILDRALLDVNGDGLPDRVDTYTSRQMWVALNLGYRFASQQIQWSTGRTQSTKGVSGTLSLGFQLNAMEFAGGVSYTEGVDHTLFDWLDVDGDGVPDRMNNVGDGDPTTVFGSGDGMLLRPEVDYGAYQKGNVAVDADKWQGVSADGDLPGADLPGGQLSVGRTTSLSGGFDFSFYIGPICVVACYIVINPGAHGGYDRSTTQVSMEDMNGDGLPDAVRSTDDEDIEVRLNTRGRTNLLKSVASPIGGSFTVDYERTGNTVADPDSRWVLASVEVDDGHPGDGPDVLRSAYEYSGSVYDRALREDLGFSEVREVQSVPGGAALRSFVRTYSNSSPFDAGQLTRERTLDAAGTLVQESTYAYGLADANPRSTEYGDAVTGLPGPGTPARVGLFDRALSPQLTSETETRFDAKGVPQGLRTDYTYDAIGDVVSVVEHNEVDTTYDDVHTAITYSACATRSGSRADVSSWVSVPQTVTLSSWVEGKPDSLLRHRNAGPDLCANSVPTRIAELVQQPGDTGCRKDLYAVTELGFDDRGSYDTVVQPSTVVPDCADYPAETMSDADYDQVTGCEQVAPAAGKPARRYCVDYVYDALRFTDIAKVTDVHGVTASATYDASTGRLASRTDENGSLTTYTYDPQGRLASVKAPKEQTGGTPTVSYRYGGLATSPAATSWAWSSADHIDVVHPGDPIQTVALVDGLGRVVQRKRDAAVSGVDGPVRIVEGAVEYDALGHEAKVWYPLVEKAGSTQLTTYNLLSSESPTAQTNVPVTKPTTFTYDVLDRLRSTTRPDGSTTTTDYRHTKIDEPDDYYASGDQLVLTEQVDTDGLGKQTSSWSDIGGLVYRIEQRAAAANAPDGTAGPLAGFPATGIAASRIKASTGTTAPIATRFEYDYLGNLLATIDAAGATTTHTYDLLSRKTSTDTPDGGLTSTTYGPAGNELAVERATGTVASSTYDGDRLLGVEYSDSTPAVDYTYGAVGASLNGVGRVVAVRDGSMRRTFAYDADGNVVDEAATRATDPFGKGWTEPGQSVSTGWSYDSLGRVLTTRYPNGEVVSTHYDIGGRPDRLTAKTPQSTLYDQYGKPVPRPDLSLTYVDAVGYDAFGQGTVLRTGTGVTTKYGFDADRRLLTSIDTDSAAQKQYDGTTSSARQLQRLRYTYDTAGNVRDVANRLYDSGKATGVSGLGVPPENGVPGGGQQSYTYDGFYRVTGAAATFTDRTTKRDYAFAADYAPNGNLLSKTQTTSTTLTTGGTKPKNTGGTPGSTTGGSSTLSSCNSDASSGGGTVNDDGKTTFKIAAGDMKYATDGDGNTIHRMKSVGARTYTYDAAGNLTDWREPCSNSKVVSRQLSYDAENRVTRLAEGNNDTDYRYSAEGRKTLERGPGGLTWFVNDYWRVVNDGQRYANIYLGEQLVATHRTSPTSTQAPSACTDTATTTCKCPPGGACKVAAATACTTTQVYDPATSTCQPRPSEKLYFLHKDLQGSLRVATDEVGSVFQYVEYLPTGRPWVVGQSTVKDTPYLFAGGWTDTTYDLVNFGERWYETREQQFYSPEPLLEDDPLAAVEQPDRLSAYTYAASNPLRYVDPSGRDAEDAQDVHTISSSSGTEPTTTDAPPRKGPAKVWFGGRAGYDEEKDNGGKFGAAADKVGQYTTLLSVQTEDGVRTVRVGGFRVNKKEPDTSPAPDTGPGATPTDTSVSTASAPSRPSSAAPDAPTANASASDDEKDSSSPADDGGAVDSSGGGAGDGSATSPPPSNVSDAGDAAPPTTGGSAGGSAAQRPATE